MKFSQRIRLCTVLFFLLISSIFQLNGQNLNIEYNVEIKPDTLNPEQVSHQIFTLFLRDKNSTFIGNGLYNLLQYQNQPDKLKVSIHDLNSFYIIHKEGTHLWHYLNFYNEFYRFDDKKTPKWALSKATRVIDSFSVRKAQAHFRGRKWTAWYTPDIPIPEGPYKFKGLPGLIVKLQSDEGDYQYKLRSISKSDQKFELPKSVTLKDRKTFLKEEKKYARSPSYKMVQKRMNEDFDYNVYINGKEVNKSEQAKAFDRAEKAFMKKHNNPIEKDEIWIR